MTTKLALLALAALSCAPAFAEEGRAYIGTDVTSTGLTMDSTTKRKFGFGLTAGYQFHENFAVEGQVRRLAHWSDSELKADFDSMNVSLLGKVPVGSRFALYGRLGLARNKSALAFGSYKVSSNQTKAVFGAGAEVWFTKDLSLRAEYVDLGSNRVGNSADDPKVKIRQFGAGLVYAF